MFFATFVCGIYLFFKVHLLYLFAADAHAFSSPKFVMYAFLPQEYMLSVHLLW